MSKSQATPPTTASAFFQLARLEAGLSQWELAERAGVAQSEIARIESGKREPSIPTLQRILAGAGMELRFRLEELGGRAAIPPAHPNGSQHRESCGLRWVTGSDSAARAARASH